ncbi:MAG: hypothetical protein IT566_07405 [Rhodospirillaceae bacterium]|nr:hypothetical protein [Rhodospirillaceae bacterium]
MKVLSLREAAERLHLSEKTLRLHLRALRGVDNFGRALYRKTSPAPNAPWRISEEQLRLIWETLPTPEAPRKGRRTAQPAADVSYEAVMDLIDERLQKAGRRSRRTPRQISSAK